MTNQQLDLRVPENRKEYFRKTFTLEGRIFFPHLTADNLKVKNGGRRVYEVNFQFAKNQNPQVMAEIHAFLENARNQLYPGVHPDYLIKTIKDGDTYIKQDGTPAPDYRHGHFFFDASTGEDIPPTVVKKDPNTGLLIQPSNIDIYSGRNAAIQVTFFAQGLVARKDGQMSKKGFGINLKMVLILEGGEQLGGSAAGNSNPEEAFAAFLGQTSTNYGQAAPAQQAAPNYGQAAPAQPAAPNYGQAAPAQPAAPNYGQAAPAQPAQPAQPNYSPGYNPGQNPYSN